ncbi:MAG: TonB family protein [Myxococcales bacterium]|nr:TonB family protein [Myxococcales bacterium]
MSIKRHLFAGGTMVVGSGLVFGGVLAMNLYSEPPKRDSSEQVTAFSVDKKPPPPKSREPKPSQQRRQARSASHAAAPVPNIGTQIAGVSFGLPTFEADLSTIASESMLGSATKDMVMTEDSVDSPAQPVARVPPEYPSKARQKGIEGYVTLNVLVSAEGSIQQMRILNADPAGIFEDSAKAALARWEFRPGQYQASPVSMWVKQTIRYKLQ